jgi:hypothetical protein
MARDPQVQHDDDALVQGLGDVAAGQDLEGVPALRAELLFLALLVEDYEGAVHLTREGRQFLATSGARPSPREAGTRG